jgi:hypothetical protein
MSWKTIAIVFVVVVAPNLTTHFMTIYYINFAFSVGIQSSSWDYNESKLNKYV